MHNFLYSLTICLLHYYPGLVESGLQSALNQCTVQTFTESEDTRCSENIIFPPEDVHVNDRNTSRIIV